MATASDVARLAGTSTAVVSYVFNDGPRGVAPSTRERVLQAASQLQYRPNRLARSLRAGRTDSVALVVPNIANPFFAELASAMELEASKVGKLLLIGDAGMDPNREDRLIETFVDRQVDALILASQRREPRLGPVERDNVSCVALHPIAATLPASSVSIDYAAAAQTAVDHLVSIGARHLGMLNTPSPDVTAEDRARGFLAASTGVKIRTSTYDVGMTRKAAYDACLQLLAAPDRPDAIFAACDEQAFGVLAAAHKLRIDVPSKLLVVGLDGTEAGQYTVPPLASVAQPIYELASRAISLALRDGGATRHLTLKSELLLRESGRRDH